MDRSGIGNHLGGGKVADDIDHAGFAFDPDARSFGKMHGEIDPVLRTALADVNLAARNRDVAGLDRRTGRSGAQAGAALFIIRSNY